MGIPHTSGEGKGPFISSVGIPSDVGKCESSAQRPAPKTYFHISMVRVETRWLCPSKDDWPGLSIPTGQINPSKQICSNICQSKRQPYQLGSDTSPRAQWGKVLPRGYPQYRTPPIATPDKGPSNKAREKTDPGGEQRPQLPSGRARQQWV